MMVLSGKGGKMASSSGMVKKGAVIWEWVVLTLWRYICSAQCTLLYWSYPATSTEC
jgi:hypothetical protein